MLPTHCKGREDFDRRQAAHGPISLDDVPLNAFHVKIAGLTFGAHLTEGFALGPIGYAFVSMDRQFRVAGYFLRQGGIRLAIGSLGTTKDLSALFSDHHRSRVSAVLCALAAGIVPAALSGLSCCRPASCISVSPSR
ncbi:protein of unknown function [Paraburkholderia dioscoreae]|uniref:Uncharacterized protein n=1 Tax=Paraburkholderia dioscoreae TaxID=2604047 RepID=A0A5Q4YV65_9BURK|nr:protein of unknown function [Paraburkholderia dioscoreae]